MSIECPPEIFAQLKARRGKYVDPTDGDMGAFCCEQYPEAGPLGLIYAPDADFSNPPLDDWPEFEYWCEDIHSLALSKLFPELPDDETTTPRQFFTSQDEFKQKLLKVIAENDGDLRYGCAGVDIVCGSETLELIYTDFMDWTFEYGSVMVIAPSDGLTEELGFYDEPLVWAQPRRETD